MIRVLGGAVAALLLACALSVAADTPALIAPYLQARDAGRTGVVTGEVFAEATRASAGPTPRSDVSVMLFPAAPVLEADLSRIRAGLRDSERNYLAAAGRLRAAREGYERALAFAGGGELSRGEVTDPAGRFRFTDVPVGQWLLLAWREVEHPVAGRQPPQRDLGAFVGNTHTRGHAAIEYWKLAVEVRPGESQDVRLYDRNMWLTVIQEDTTTPTSRAETVEGARGSKRR
jgi:hypothetical protein